MSEEVWTLIPHVGIELGETHIHFGDDRQAVRAIMRDRFGAPVPNGYPDEDDFRTSGDALFIRVRYNDTQVRDIEFIAGRLRYDGVELHDDTTFPAIEESLQAKGYVFRPTEWLNEGHDCVGLAISIATREEVGGDGDEIEWVILSSNYNA